MDDAFDHHTWATLRLIDACADLSPEQLATTVPGTFGSILDTLRHTLDGDRYFLWMLDPERMPLVDVGTMGLLELRATMDANGQAWSRLLASGLDGATMVRDLDETGCQRDASIGLRLAQALHHGSDHRSQVCTALASLGIEPPWIDLWAFGEATGRVVERRRPESER
jgi:uncharacterized damage-inducible protein DinB